MVTSIKGNATSTFGGDVDLGSNNLSTTGTIPAPAALSTATGSAPSYSARAWVNFNGTGTVAIRASGNVSSITDNATGNYTVNLTTAMPDANGAATVEGSLGTPFGDQVDYKEALIASSSTIQIGTFNGSWADCAHIYVAIFR